MLIVVKNRDADLLETVLDLETPRRSNVLEVDATERRCDGADEVDDRGRFAHVDDDGDGIDTGELTKQRRLSLHDRQSGLRSDVAQTQDRRAVGDDGHAATLPRQVPRGSGICGDHLTGTRHSGRVGDREIVLRFQAHA